MNGLNPFQNANIIQILGQSCSISDKEFLKKLRELSTTYNNILNKTYYDLLQIQLSVDMENNYLTYIFPSESSERELLKFKDWNPIIAQRIRVLQLTVENNSEYLDITPSSLENMDFFHLLFHQLFPHVTTLKFYHLPWRSNTFKLLNFIQQFINLKKISFQIVYSGEQSYLNDFESGVSTLKSSGIIVELRLFCYGARTIENEILNPEKGLKDVIHQLGFDIPVINEVKHLERFAQLITENHSIISNIKLEIHETDLAQHGNQQFEAEIILKHLRVISPFVHDLEWCTTECDIDILNTVEWPFLTSLKLENYAQQLPDLSICCPKLQSLTVEAIEVEVFFSNSPRTETFKQDLYHIFRGCTKSLKRLKIIPTGPDEYQEEDWKVIRPNDELHQYLQKLLPHTIVEVK